MVDKEEARGLDEREVQALLVWRSDTALDGFSGSKVVSAGLRTGPQIKCLARVLPGVVGTQQRSTITRIKGQAHSYAMTRNALVCSRVPGSPSL